MNRTAERACASLIFIWAAMANAQPVPNEGDPIVAALKELQGEWKMVKIEISNNITEESFDPKQWLVIFNGDQLEIKAIGEQVTISK